MSWQRRLKDLVRAGGTLAAVVSLDACNKFPDPCLCTPAGYFDARTPQCEAVAGCEANGGYWVCAAPSEGTTAQTEPAGIDAGSQVEGYCSGYPLDAGPDARPPDAAHPPDARTHD